MTQVDVSVLVPDAHRGGGGDAMGYIAPGYPYPWGFSLAKTPPSAEPPANE